MKRIINIAILLMTVVMAQAATSFTVEAPRQVIEGNKFNVTFVLNNGEGSSFTPPEVTGAKLIYGPSVSHSYSSSWVNGKSSSSSSEEYTMIYKATSPGKCHIGPASIVVGGKRMATKALTIDVVSSGSHANHGTQQQTTPGAPTPYSDPMNQTADKEVSSKDLFVRIQLSKPRVYEQQAVVCTIKLYTKYQISQFMPTIQPSFDGFLIEEIPVQPALNTVETLNGERYMTAILKQCILYPQQSGQLTITSGNYDVSVVQFDTFKSIFGSVSKPVGKDLKVTSNKATVNILPLPEPKPASFTGAVGRFNVTTDLKPATGLKTYSAATYRYIISGTIMLFVPGVAITTSIRDFLSGDMISGLSRMVEAVGSSRRMRSEHSSAKSLGRTLSFCKPHRMTEGELRRSFTQRVSSRLKLSRNWGVSYQMWAENWLQNSSPCSSQSCW